MNGPLLVYCCYSEVTAEAVNAFQSANTTTWIRASVIQVSRPFCHYGIIVVPVPIFSTHLFLYPLLFPLLIHQSAHP